MVEMQPTLVFSIDIIMIVVHLNWLIWLHFFILMGGHLVHLVHDFLSSRPGGVKMPVYTDWFSLTFDLNSFMSRVNRHLLSLGFF